MRIVIGFALCRIWIQCLQDMLDAHNPYIQNFHQIRDILLTNDVADIWYIYANLLWSCHYNTPTASDVAAIMISIIKSGYSFYSKLRDNSLQRILHLSYDPLQYALLSPKGDDGCRRDNGSTVKVRGRIHLDNRWVSFSRSSEALNKKTCWLGEYYECYQKRSIIECFHRF